MISSFATPSVCLVDDEPEDYEPILKALNQLYISCVHFEGDSASTLPPTPFKSLRLIFTDLHLNNTSGKTAASHAANVFKRLVSTESAPVVVVIWSKYADETASTNGDPVDDQPSEAALFKQELLAAEPKYAGRLIFVQMPKPKANDGRPANEEWVRQLKNQIQEVLKNQDGVKALWAWESLVNQSGLGVSSRLTNLANGVGKPTTEASLNEGLITIMRKLRAARGGDDKDMRTAPRHVTSVLAQLLVDEIEHQTPNLLDDHGNWLMVDDTSSSTANLTAKINTLLLTASISDDSTCYLPGMVYKISGNEGFKRAFGCELNKFKADCFTGKIDDAHWAGWIDHVEPVLIELSPACDVANSNRTTASLLAGLLVPTNLDKHAKKQDAWSKTATFMSRTSPLTNAETATVLVFCARYKVTLPVNTSPKWITPLFRMRELQTTMLRNWLAGQTARVGLVTL